MTQITISHILLINEELSNGEKLIQASNQHNCYFNVRDYCQAICHSEGLEIMGVLFLFLALRELLVSFDALFHYYCFFVGGFRLGFFQEVLWDFYCFFGLEVLDI